MKIPKYIRNKMHKIAALNNESKELMNEVESWLESHGIDPYDIRDGSGTGLEELEYGEDITEELCTRIEERY